MELIRNLGSLRDKNDNYYSIAEFLCPFCLQIVIRRLSSGKIAKSCGCKTNELKSESNKGKKKSEEHKQNISISKQGKQFGKNNPNYGNGDKIKGVNNPFYGKNHTEETRQKIREFRKGIGNTKHKENCNCIACKSKRGETFGKNNPMYGKNLTDKARQKIRESREGKYVGKLSPNWQGGISFEEYGIEFNKELKKFILERDNYKCQYPGCTEIHKRLAIHHIDYNKKNNNPENLITLGTSCHTKTNFNRLFWIEFYQDIMRNKS